MDNSLLNKLPKKVVRALKEGKSFAHASSLIRESFKDRDDAESKATEQEMMHRLRMLQEHVKRIKETPEPAPNPDLQAPNIEEMPQEAGDQNQYFLGGIMDALGGIGGDVLGGAGKEMLGNVVPDLVSGGGFGGAQQPQQPQQPELKSMKKSPLEAGIKGGASVLGNLVGGPLGGMVAGKLADVGINMVNKNEIDEEIVDLKSRPVYQAAAQRDNIHAVNQNQDGGVLDKDKDKDKDKKKKLSEEQVSEINKLTGVEFLPEKANELFEYQEAGMHQPMLQPDIDLGYYKDLGYFDVKNQGTNYVITPTSKNPQNAQGFKEQLNYIKSLNPSAKFDDRYQQFQNRYQDGGMMHASPEANLPEPISSSAPMTDQQMSPSFGYSAEPYYDSYHYDSRRSYPRRQTEGVFPEDLRGQYSIDKENNHGFDWLNSLFNKGEKAYFQPRNENAISQPNESVVSQPNKPKQPNQMKRGGYLNMYPDGGETERDPLPKVNPIYSSDLMEDPKLTSPIYQGINFNSNVMDVHSGRLLGEAGKKAKSEMDDYYSSNPAKSSDDDEKKDKNRALLEQIGMLAPTAATAYQLWKNRKPPRTKPLNKLDMQYEKSRPDYARYENLVKEDMANRRAGLISSAGGSGSAARASLLGNQVRGVGDLAKFMDYGRGVERDENRFKQQFDSSIARTNLYQDNLYRDITDKDEQAHKDFMNEGVAQLGTNIHDVAKMNLYKKFPEMMGADYDWLGNFLDKIIGENKKNKGSKDVA